MGGVVASHPYRKLESAFLLPLPTRIIPRFASLPMSLKASVPAMSYRVISGLKYSVNSSPYLETFNEMIDKFKYIFTKKIQSSSSNKIALWKVQHNDVIANLRSCSKVLQNAIVLNRWKHKTLE